MPMEMWADGAQSRKGSDIRVLISIAPSLKGS